MIKATQDQLKFLDQLRKSGDVNMFGARPYLQEAFPELSKMDAAAVLTEWMQTFAQRHGKEGT